MGRDIAESERGATIDSVRERVGAKSLPLVRLLVAGAVGSGVVHEFANLLTVIEGNRQMAEMGFVRSGSDPTREPVERARGFIEAYRYVFGAADPTYDAPAAQDLDAIASLVRVKLRGRPCRVVVDPAAARSSGVVPARISSGARFCYLAAVIGAIDSSPSASSVELAVTVEHGTVTSFDATVRGIATARDMGPDSAPILAAAGTLATELRADLRREATDGAIVLRLMLPA